MDCAKCGAVLPADATFCGKCGTPVGAMTQKTVIAVPRAASTARQRRAGILMVAAGVGLLIFAVAYCMRQLPLFAMLPVAPLSAWLRAGACLGMFVLGVLLFCSGYRSIMLGRGKALAYISMVLTILCTAALMAAIVLDNAFASLAGGTMLLWYGCALVVVAGFLLRTAPAQEEE